MAKTLSYGKLASSDAPDCVLLCQHDSAGDDFLREHPEIEDACEVGPQTFKDYRNLERDSGSYELTLAIASVISDMSNGEFEVNIVKSNVPRAIVDLNRATRCAVRNVFEHEAHPKLLRELQSVHFNEINVVRRALFSLLETNGIFVDVHTMAPYSPVRTPDDAVSPLNEAPDRLGRYIRTYLDADKHNRSRDVEIMTADGRRMLADAKLVFKMRQRLAEAGIEFKENDPFTPEAYMMITEYMMQSNGLLIDVPKDQISDSKVKEGGFNLVYPKISPEKVMDAATPIGLAVVDTLRERRARA